MSPVGIKRDTECYTNSCTLHASLTHRWNDTSGLLTCADVLTLPLTVVELKISSGSNYFLSLSMLNLQYPGSGVIFVPDVSSHLLKALANLVDGL